MSTPGLHQNNEMHSAFHGVKTAKCLDLATGWENDKVWCVIHPTAKMNRLRWIV